VPPYARGAARSFRLRARVAAVDHLVSVLNPRQMDGPARNEIRPGRTVEIVQKHDQGTGRRTRGIVQEILTRSPTHPHGIKVRLTTGEVGRVKALLG
jgi:uncharacterized repeat protein (TIGR03833 family)